MIAEESERLSTVVGEILTGAQLDAGAHQDRPRALQPAGDRRRRGRGVLGAQIHPSCCSGVFVDQSAESVMSVELVWRA